MCCQLTDLAMAILGMSHLWSQTPRSILALVALKLFIKENIDKLYRNKHSKDISLLLRRVKNSINLCLDIKHVVVAHLEDMAPTDV